MRLQTTPSRVNHSGGHATNTRLMSYPGVGRIRCPPPSSPDLITQRGRDFILIDHMQSCYLFHSQSLATSLMTLDREPEGKRESGSPRTLVCRGGTRLDCSNRQFRWNRLEAHRHPSQRRRGPNKKKKNPLPWSLRFCSSSSMLGIPLQMTPTGKKRRGKNCPTIQLCLEDSDTKLKVMKSPRQTISRLKARPLRSPPTVPPRQYTSSGASSLASYQSPRDVENLTSVTGFRGG